MEYRNKIDVAATYARPRGRQKEASAPVLAATFNKYFREFGRILNNNVSRDLSALKAKGRYVNNDPNKEPQTWYLLEDGKKEVERLLTNLSSEGMPDNR